MFDYVARLHHSYRYSIEYVLYELEMELGWLLYSWALANDPINRFGGLSMVNSPASQEADKILEGLKKTAVS